ncbi:hypothetical protein IAT38_001361 [Cryptococcus sp. DSM 104549]
MASPSPSPQDTPPAQDNSPTHHHDLLPLSLDALHPVHHLLLDELYHLVPYKCSLLSRYHNSRLLRTRFGRVEITPAFVDWLLDAPHLEHAGDTTTPEGRSVLRKELVLSQIHTFVITSWHVLPAWDQLLPKFQSLVARNNMPHYMVATALFPKLERFEWDMGVLAKEMGEMEVGRENHLIEGWSIFLHGTAAEGAVEYVVREQEGGGEIPSWEIAHAVTRYAIPMPFCSSLVFTFPDSVSAASLAELCSADGLRLGITIRDWLPFQWLVHFARAVGRQEKFLQNFRYGGYEMPVDPNGGVVDKGWREMQKFCTFEELDK